MLFLNASCVLYTRYNINRVGTRQWPEEEYSVNGHKRFLSRPRKKLHAQQVRSCVTVAIIIVFVRPGIHFAPHFP